MVGLSFRRIVVLADGACRPCVPSRVALLYDVGQLVNQQLHPGQGVRLVHSLTHYNVPPERVRLRMNRMRRLSGLGIGVDLYLPEVVTQPLLQIRPSGRVQRPARGAKDLGDAEWNLRRSGRAVARPVGRLTLIVVARTRWALDATAALDLRGYQYRPQRYHRWSRRDGSRAHRSGARPETLPPVPNSPLCQGWKSSELQRSVAHRNLRRTLRAAS
jgi:hypothetical protein